MALPKQAQASAASPFGDLRSSWSHSSPLSWQVSSASMEWSLLSLSVRKVHSIPLSQERRFLQLQIRIQSYGFRFGVRVQLCGNCVFYLGCRLCYWHCRRCGNPFKRSARKVIRGSHFDPHFRWGLSTLWTHCVPHPCYVTSIICLSVYWVNN